jgi:predicted nucleic acid-binding protein
LRILVDSYAWVELFLGSVKGGRVKGLIESADEALTPDTVLAELYRKYLREKIPERLVRKRLSAVQGASHVISITPELAMSASKAYLELVEEARKRRMRTPSLFDGLVLGAARLHEAKVVTGDPHFLRLPETIWL